MAPAAAMASRPEPTSIRLRGRRRAPSGVLLIMSVSLCDLRVRGRSVATAGSIGHGAGGSHRGGPPVFTPPLGGIREGGNKTRRVDVLDWADLPSLRRAGRLDELPLALIVVTRPTSGGSSSPRQSRGSFP